jgi:4-diphosphocytidyl-2-C-methyl-D-erythritol kinase
MRMDDGSGGSLRVRVPAKINLHLAVGPRRSDGYHDVVSVMQTVGIFDTLTLHRTDDAHGAHPSARRLMRIALALDTEGSPDGVPIDGGNLIVVAAGRLMQHLGMRPAGPAADGAPGVGPQQAAAGEEAGPSTLLRLTKRIPVAAGMAGGSADAAAALVGLNRLWEADLDGPELRELGAAVGSDVPFCVLGGTALATGTGTSVASVLTRGRAHWVIGIDREPLSTADVYAMFDALEPPAPTSPDRILQALRTGDVDALAAGLHNDLEAAAMTLRPALRARRDAMQRAGALATIVSGSGPTLLALVRDASHARQVAADVADAFDAVEVATSPAGGPEILVGRQG